MKIIQVTTLSPSLRSFPAESFLTFLPILTISPVPSCPKATGIKLNGSLLNSCASVPQTPQPSTLTRISSSPTSGIGNSLISNFSNSVSIATCAVEGIPVPDALAAGAAPAALPDIWSRICLTINSTSCSFTAISFFSFSYLMQRLSDIVQRLLFVKLCAAVKPSPVLEAIVNVQYPSPPNPSAA